jgi:putative ATPase
MPNLFGIDPADRARPGQPLADRMRPAHLAEVVGQDHLVGDGGALTRLIDAGSLGSLIFWGPPGTGKTTVARLLAGATTLYFEPLSAIFSGVADLKKIFEAARIRRGEGQSTLLFVDEIHRFNRSQQDAFLPVMEDGTVTLVGATTENPSFALNAALLSRARVLTVRALGEQDILDLLARAETIEGKPLPLDEAARVALARMADGDGRAALTLAEEIWRAARAGEVFDTAGLVNIVQRRAPIYDKSEDGHYNLISALHKSIRGSDPDVALLAGSDAGCRRKPAVSGPPSGPDGLGRYRAGRSAGFAGRPSGQGEFRILGLARRRIGAGRGRGLSGNRTQIQCCLCGVEAGFGQSAVVRLADAAQNHSERPDQTDEAGGIRGRLCL